MDGFERAQKVGPFLKHLTPFIKIRGMVVGVPDGILLLVGKLRVDNVAVKASVQFLLIENRGEHGSETVNSHFFLAEAHTPDAVQKRHVRNAPACRMPTRKT